MTIKKTVVTTSTSMLLAMGLSIPAFAATNTEVVDADEVTIECIPAAELEAMTEEDKANLTLPVCEDVQKNEEGATTTQ